MLTQVFLQYFRSYEQLHVPLKEEKTVVVGANASGKTSFIEAVSLCLTGKSFRANKAQEMIMFDHDMARVQIELVDNEEKTRIEVVITDGQTTGGRAQKKIFINGIARSRGALVGLAPVILFRPEEMDIISDGPSLRRSFLDDTLEQVSREYVRAKREYEKALRQRNALLHLAKETGIRKVDEFNYWDDILIHAGQVITHSRREFLHAINSLTPELFAIRVAYDPSEISRERLDQYANEEVAAGVTLVGPQRDDFTIFMGTQEVHSANMQLFASRGQQRLAILQLKLFQKQYIEDKIGKKALVLLDDIFSELDSSHISLVMEKLQQAQLILTTTHEEFVNLDSESVQKVHLT